MNEYWHKQLPNKPLFEDTLWSKPERRDQSGRLVIVGGNGQGFWSVALAYQVAKKLGVGEIRVLMPDSLQSKLPKDIRAQIDDLLLLPSNPSGGFSLKSMDSIIASAHWSENLLLIGDMGANSETAQLVDRLLIKESAFNVKTTLARDAVDLVALSAESILTRENLNMFISLAQFQKIARAVYYPRVIVFKQGPKQIAETLHKFTLTYNSTITLFHENNLFVANSGSVVSYEFTEPMRVWNGEIPTRAACWSVWSSDMLKAVATSWVNY